jgi:hypothetical protein
VARKINSIVSRGKKIMQRKELMEALSQAYPSLKFEQGITQILIYPQFWKLGTTENVAIPRVATFSEEEVAKILATIEPIAKRLIGEDQAKEQLVKEEVAVQEAAANALVKKYQNSFRYPLRVAAYRSYYEIWIEVRPGENQRTIGRAPIWIPYVGLAYGGEYSNPKANPMATSEDELIDILPGLEARGFPIITD